MLIIAERINAARQPIAEALAGRDAAPIQEEARRQTEAGADFLDVNTAVSPETEAELMAWAVETVRDATDRPLCIDTTSPEAARAALKRLPRATAILNSISGETGRLEQMLPLAAEFETRLVALMMDDSGMPTSCDDRWRALDKVFAATDKAGIPRRRIFVDPLVRPIATDPDQASECLAMIRQIPGRCEGAGAVVGLSNVSFGLPQRTLLNRTFLSMAIGAGLSAAILDPLAPGVMGTLLAAGCLAGHDPYCAAYIAAVREGRL